jgi:hypothetical protein
LFACFSLRALRSPLSVSFHQCSTLIFICMLLLAEGQTGEAWEEPFKSTRQSRSLALNATDSEGRVLQPHRYSSFLEVSGPVQQDWRSNVRPLNSKCGLVSLQKYCIYYKRQSWRDWREVRTVQATRGATDHHSQRQTKTISAMKPMSLGSFGHSCAILHHDSLTNCPDSTDCT